MRAARVGGLSSAKEGWVQSRMRQRVSEKARIARMLRILAVSISLSPLLTGWPANNGLSLHCSRKLRACSIRRNRWALKECCERPLRPSAAAGRQDPDRRDRHQRYSARPDHSHRRAVQLQAHWRGALRVSPKRYRQRQCTDELERPNLWRRRETSQDRAWRDQLDHG